MGEDARSGSLRQRAGEVDGHPLSERDGVFSRGISLRKECSGGRWEKGHPRRCDDCASRRAHGPRL